MQTDKDGSGDLGRRSLGALKWNYLGTLTRSLSQFLLGILLARLLGPEPFGLVAIAWMVLAAGNLLADFGLSAALIQQREIDASDIRRVFTLQILIGLLLSLLLFGCAPLLADFYRDARVAPVLAWMSLMFLLQAAGQTATALLRRNLDHKAVQVRQIGSYLSAYLLVGLPLAFNGAGVWALVVAQLLQAGLYSASCYLCVRHSVRPLFGGGGRSLLDFGGKVLFCNLTSWGYVNLDAAIIGRLRGVAELGFYNRAINLLSAPMFAVVSTLQGVLFPVYSRLQNEPERARDTYLAVLCLLGMLVFPVFCAVAVMPTTVVLAVYGEAWRAATPLITPLSLAMPVYALMAMAGPVMLGLGHAGREARAQAFGVLCMIAILIPAAQFSLAASAWAVLAAYILRALLVGAQAWRLLALPLAAAGRVVAGPLLLGVLSAGIAGGLDWMLASWLPASRLLAVMVAIGVLGVMAIGGLRWLLCREACQLLVQALPHLPQRLAALLHPRLETLRL